MTEPETVIGQRPPPRPTLARAMRSGGRLRVRALGVRTALWEDAYHRLMQTSWPRLALMFAACFLLFNLSFAALYRLDPTGLAVPHDAEPISLFWHDFFFSVHTVATIGYGNIFPVSAYANIVVVAEITLGILFFALTTGIVFARFSRPTGRILLTDVMVVRKIDGVPTLTLRAANLRHNLIYSAHVGMALLDDRDIAGIRMRRFFDLKLVRENNPVFVLTWTIMHAIDADSPLYGWLSDPASIGDSEIVVILSGTDESSGHTIYGRGAYGAEDIHWDARFVDVVGTDEQGVRTVDYSNFHKVLQD
jgi:inward rectifier potassium channel